MGLARQNRSSDIPLAEEAPGSFVYGPASEQPLEAASDPGAEASGPAGLWQSLMARWIAGGEVPEAGLDAAPPVIPEWWPIG